MAFQRTFYYIWELIDRFVRARNSHFGREIIACIFWEESCFINQGNRAGAVGFGQVMSKYFDDINGEFNTLFTVQGVLASDAQSVEIAILFLELWFNKKGSVDAALRGYGYFPHSHSYTRWKRAEADLIRIGLPLGPIALPPPPGLVDGVARALQKCAQPGWDPYKVLAALPARYG